MTQYEEAEPTGSPFNAFAPVDRDAVPTSLSTTSAIFDFAQGEITMRNLDTALANQVSKYLRIREFRTQRELELSAMHARWVREQYQAKWAAAREEANRFRKDLSLKHICRCPRTTLCSPRWSPDH